MDPGLRRNLLAVGIMGDPEIRDSELRHTAAVTTLAYALQEPLRSKAEAAAPTLDGTIAEHTDLLH